MADDREALERRLRGLFAEELDEGLRELNQGLLQLEKGHDSADVRELFRTAHGLKGAAHAAGVQDAVDICDRMETVLAAIRDGDVQPGPGVVASLLADVDVLGEVASSLGSAAEAGGGHRLNVEAGRGSPPAGPPARGSARREPQDDPPPASPVPPASPASPTSPAPPSRPEAPAAVPMRTVRVAVDKLDALLASAGESLTASQRLAVLSPRAAASRQAVEASRQRWRSLRILDTEVAVPQELAEVGTLLDEAHAGISALEQSLTSLLRDMDHTSGAVAEAAQALRLQPVGAAWEGLDRVVRDVATAAGKQARLTLRGGEVEADRAVVAALRDPLLHLVRNAADHGLETPAVRIARGKPATGTVAVSAELRDGMVAITVVDDGAGIDVEALRAVAEERGIAPPSAPLDLAAVPGLTTSATVTAISGRGVGLDAVRAGVEEIGGSLDLASEPGAGTTFSITVPTTFATMRVLLTEVAGEVVCLPVPALERVTTFPAADVREVEGDSVIDLSGRARRTVALAAALGWDAADRDLHAGQQLHAAVVRGGDAVLVVDRFLADVEVVIKPAPQRVAGAAATLGVTVLSGGRPALVVNPAALARSGAPARAGLRRRPAQPRRSRVLLAEDTATTRALERSILEAAGYDVLVAVDGAQAWQLLQSEEVDVVVTDVQMPGLDGFELCEAIRSAPQLRELPVLLVTSLAGDEDRRRGVEAGADAYFVKSDFDQGGLLETLERLL